MSGQESTANLQLTSLYAFLEGIGCQLDWHLTHVCPDCPTIQIIREKVTRLKVGLEGIESRIASGEYSDEQVATTLREAGEFLVFFGPVPKRVTLSGCMVAV